jgi:hypothetical protein
MKEKEHIMHAGIAMCEASSLYNQAKKHGIKISALQFGSHDG